jgi:hypothetical protein
MQTPQGFDAQHDGELFPIDENKLTSLGLAGCECARRTGEALLRHTAAVAS